MNSQHNSFLIDAISVRRKAAAIDLDLAQVIWDDECPSTNDELAALVRESQSSAATPAEFTVRGTDHQNAGHGRLGRTWTVPERKSLTFSILLKPGAVFDSWGWIPLLTGEAVRAAIAEVGVPAVLKWPNDVLTTEGKKLCGILARIEALDSGPHIVLGMGINTRLESADLPRESASSLAIELARDGGADEVAGAKIVETGAAATGGLASSTAVTDAVASVNDSGPDHEDLLISVLSKLIPAYQELVDYDGDNFSDSMAAERVRANMVTLRSRVRVERPDGSSFVGLATGLDAGGDLIIDNDIHISAGDVHHLRMADD